MKKSLSICLLIVCIVIAFIFLSGFLSGGAGSGYLYIKEIKDINNGTYFEITDDELKEHPEIRGGELNSDEVSRVSTFFNIKHSKYLFNIDTKFKNNLNDNIIDAELMNTFKSNGFPLSENYSILAISRFYYNTPYNSWFLNEKVNTPEYTIYEINDELKVYKSGYIEYQFVKIGEHYYEIRLAVT